MPFSASAIFCFTSSTSANPFLSEDFFHPGKQKKVAQDEIQWIERVGHRGHAIFG